MSSEAFDKTVITEKWRLTRSFIPTTIFKKCVVIYLTFLTNSINYIDSENNLQMNKNIWSGIFV